MWTRQYRLQQRLCRLPSHYRRENAGDRFGELMSLAIIKRYGYNSHWVWKYLNERGYDDYIATCSGGGPTPPPPVVKTKKVLRVSEESETKVIATQRDDGSECPLQVEEANKNKEDAC